ncbi:MAG TPA: tetratricopeptide repeat protein [Terriglobia bacterium]|nr:tetratricopeptide repeat protein [Terriglobia bacterium]
MILNNLARVLFDQNKYEESQPLYERALKVLEQSVGPQHPKLATPKSNLAKLYLVQGKTEFARKLYRESVAIMEKALGPDHAKVVRAKQKLAHFLRDSESRTIGICPECNEVVTAKQPWEYVDGRAVHSICKP